MNRMVEIKLKRIEWILSSVNCNRKGIEKTILQNSKTKELRALVDLIKDAQKLIEEIEDLPLQEEYMRQLDMLEFSRRSMLYPAIILVEA